MDELLEILARIEKQNLEILALVSPRANGKFLSVEDAARQLRRSAWTIRRLCNTEHINAIKGNDGCWQIPSDEVARLQEEGVPQLPKRTPVPFLLAARQGKDGGSAASSRQSHAPSMSL
jgi:hypothetical protein